MLAGCAAALLLLLQGCIGMETTIKFSQDGSGSLSVTYRVSQFVTKLGTAEGEQGRVPLPISADDFRAAVADAAGVSLAGEPRWSENEDDLELEAVLRFDRVESVNRVRGFDTMPSTLTQEAAGWTYRLVLSEGTEGGQTVDAQTLQMVRDLFAGYTLSFRIEAPGPVKSASLGIREDNTVTYEVPIADVLAMTQRTVLEVVW